MRHPAINQPVDSAQRIEQVTSTLSDGQHPATLAQGTGLPNSNSICYTAWGAVLTLQNPCVGSGCAKLQETYLYNKRMQTAVAELGTSKAPGLVSCREYSYYEGVAATGCSATPSNWPAGTSNNGNVAGYLFQDTMGALGHTATYHYDGVNRLHTAVATGNVAYNQTYTYETETLSGQYGNLSCSANPPNPKCLATTYLNYPINNRINYTTTNTVNTYYTYDAAGNVTNDGTYGYQWDAEGKLTAITLSGNTIAANIYNALGQTMRHQVPGVTIDEYYGADGFLLGRGTGTMTDTRTRVFVPFQGRILAEYYGGSPQGTLFDHPDELGSLSTAIDYATSHSAKRLFYPFGEMWTGSDLYSLNPHQTFAQLPDYDNDSNSDLYNTLNRHYTPMGRWLSPDPGGVKVVNLDDPQTWNMYAYVRNNPTTLTDPTGLQSNSPDDPRNCSVSGEAPCLADARARSGGLDQDSTRQTAEDLAQGAFIGLWNTVASTLNLVLAQDTNGNYTPLPELQTDNTTQAIGSLASAAIFFMIPGGEEGGAAGGAKLASRAGEIHAALDDAFAIGKRTTAVADVTNADGTASTVVASSRASLAPAQRAALREGEVALSGKGGVHAEQKITGWAERNGARINAIAASRTICPSCQAVIRTMFDIMFH
jgi:RHS repeat-associated protein